MGCMPPIPHPIPLLAQEWNGVQFFFFLLHAMPLVFTAAELKYNSARCQQRRCTHAISYRVHSFTPMGGVIALPPFLEE